MRPIETVLARQMKLGWRRANRMLRQGDDASAVRPVQHVAYFLLRPWPAERAASQLAAEGYQVSRSTAGLHHVLHFEAPAALNEADQAAFIAQILLIVHLHGGTYEGWRAPVRSRATFIDRRQRASDTDMRRG